MNCIVKQYIIMVANRLHYFRCTNGLRKIMQLKIFDDPWEQVEKLQRYRDF